MNSQTISQRLRGLHRVLRDARMGTPLSAETIRRAEAEAADCANEVERMEICAGTASVATQLKAAGGNPVMLREVLRADSARKVVRHG